MPVENLKNDPSEWVRRSVANSLNDIAKDHPDIVLKIARLWKGGSKETDAIVSSRGRTFFDRTDIERCLEFQSTLKSRFARDLSMLDPAFAATGSSEG